MKRLQAGIFTKTEDNANYFAFNDMFIDYNSDSLYVPSKMLEIAEIWREDVANLIRFGHMVIVSTTPGLEFANNRWEKHPC